MGRCATRLQFYPVLVACSSRETDLGRRRGRGTGDKKWDVFLLLLDGRGKGGRTEETSLCGQFFCTLDFTASLSLRYREREKDSSRRPV